jgi:deazaflavin-dependent oxidoreductase (nitroreductase family)
MVRDIAAMLPRGGDTGCDDRRMRRRPEVARTAVAGSVVAGCVVACVWVPSVSVAGEVHEQRVVVGTSAGGRDLVAVHRWADGATRTTLVIGSMHGDEPAGTRVVRRLRSAPVPPGADLWLLPTVNPDGAAAGRRTNDQGVDLNRNFPRHWVEAGEGTATWSGPTPASEPETRAVQALLRQVRPRTVVVLHQPLFGVLPGEVDDAGAPAGAIARPAGALLRLRRRVPRHADRLAQRSAARPSRHRRAGEDRERLAGAAHRARPPAAHHTRHDGRLTVSTRKRRWTRIGNRIGVWMYRTLDGRMASGMKDVHVLMVTSPGRRTGIPRSTCVRYLDAPDGFLVWGTGSGSPQDPDWFRNLRAAPEAEVQVRDRRLRARARELVGTERDATWRDVVLVQAPEVAKFERRAGRTIPVAVLTPVADRTAGE